MLHFFKRILKKVNTTNIENYKQAIKAIKIFIVLEEWDKVYKAIKEIEQKEKRAYNILIRNLEDTDIVNDELKAKYIKDYNYKVKELEKLKTKTKKLEEEHNKAMNIKRFQIQFNNLKGDIKSLIKTKKSEQALKVLTNFLEENKENSTVINFYNKEKKIILKAIKKQREIEDNKMKDNADFEAAKLTGDTKKIEELKKQKELGKSFFQRMMQKLNFYKNIKERLGNKKLFDEINILIEENDKNKSILVEQKLANIHKGLIKELKEDRIEGYELYGKILGAEKISGDTFGLLEGRGKYNFFLGDATGHGTRAGFIVTLLSRLFNDLVNKNDLKKLCYKINNGLKQSLESRNFITGVFFEIEKNNIESVKYVGMGHEPMLIYRNKTGEVEKVIPGGLAAGIRLIKDENNIKVKDIKLEDNDILIIYSDGIPEAKNEEGGFYGIDKLKDSFQKIAILEKDINKIYNYIIRDLTIFRGGSHFDDDATLLLLKRNKDKEIIDKDSSYLKELQKKESMSDSQINSMEGKTRDQIKKELGELKKQREIQNIIKKLEQLYYSGEVLRLKEEAVNFIKQGYIHKKINYFLKKALDNESHYKIEQKEIKMENKYNILKELYKKGDFATVIKETENIIIKDGKI